MKPQASSAGGTDKLTRKRYEDLSNFIKKNSIKNMMDYLDGIEIKTNIVDLKTENPVYLKWQTEKESREESTKASRSELERSIRELKRKILNSERKLEFSITEAKILAEDNEEQIKKILFVESKRTYSQNAAVSFSPEVIAEVNELYRLCNARNDEIANLREKVAKLRKDILEKTESLDNINNNGTTDENTIDTLWLEFLKALLGESFGLNIINNLTTEEMEKLVNDIYNLYKTWVQIRNQYQMSVDYFTWNEFERNSMKKAQKKRNPTLLSSDNIFKNAETDQARQTKITELVKLIRITHKEFETMQKIIDEMKKKGGSTSMSETSSIQSDIFIFDLKTRKCGVRDCDLVAPYVCGACQKISYCSHKHQKQDWINHKRGCYKM